MVANKTLKAYVAANRPGTPFVGLGTSLSAQKHKGGISGGTLASLITSIEEYPKEVRREGMKPYSISPCAYFILSQSSSSFLLC